MNRRGIGKIGAILSIIFYALAMVTPRRLPKDELKTSNFLKQIFHEILYYGGSLEPLANFVLLILVFISLILLFGRSNSTSALLICLMFSSTAELTQRFIPGRVSSLQDLILNCLGAVSCFVIYKFYLRSKFKK